MNLPNIDQVTDTASAAKKTIEKLGDDTGKAAMRAQKAAVAAAKDASNVLTDEAEALASTALDFADQGFSMAKERFDDMATQSAKLAKAAERSIKKNPLMAVAIAAGVGILFAGVASRVGRGSHT